MTPLYVFSQSCDDLPDGCLDSRPCSTHVQQELVSMLACVLQSTLCCRWAILSYTRTPSCILLENGMQVSEVMGTGRDSTPCLACTCLWPLIHHLWLHSSFCTEGMCWHLSAPNSQLPVCMKHRHSNPCKSKNQAHFETSTTWTVLLYSRLTSCLCPVYSANCTSSSSFFFPPRDGAR